MLTWISETERLPPVAQKVLLAVPRQCGEFWDLNVAQILIRHEGVMPKPIAKGDRWPVDYYWSRDKRDTILITGNAWWALTDKIPLPPGAEHMTERGFHYVAQPSPVFISQSK